MTMSTLLSPPDEPRDRDDRPATDRDGRARPAGAPALVDLPPVLPGRRVDFTTTDDELLPLMYELVHEPEMLLRWRMQGRAVSPEEFVRQLWGGVLTQFVTEDRVRATPVSWVCAYDAHLRDQHVKVAAVTWPYYRRTIQSVESQYLFVRHLFDNFPLRKIYLEVPAFNLGPLRHGVGRYCELEATLRQHTYRGGTWHDLHVYALYRDGFERFRDRHDHRFVRTTGGAGSPSV